MTLWRPFELNFTQPIVFLLNLYIVSQVDHSALTHVNADARVLFMRFCIHGSRCSLSSTRKPMDGAWASVVSLTLPSWSALCSVTSVTAYGTSTTGLKSTRNPMARSFPRSVCLPYVWRRSATQFASSAWDGRLVVPIGVRQSSLVDSSASVSYKFLVPLALAGADLHFHSGTCLAFQGILNYLTDTYVV